MNNSRLFSLTTIGLREAFVSFIPYVIFISVLTLVLQILRTFGFDLPVSSALLSQYFPLVLFVLIIYHLSNRHHANFTLSFLVSISILLTMHSLIAKEEAGTSLFDTIGFLFILVPITTVTTLRAYKVSSMGLLLSKSDTDNLMKSFFVLIQVYGAWVMIYWLLYTAFSHILSLVNLDIPNDIFAYIQTFFVQLFWFAGMHGDNTVNLITNTDLMAEAFSPTISYGEVFNLFVLNGGSGATSALILAIFIGVKERHMRRIAQISIPFSLFNISEVMVFGLPIVFNRYLLFPFILIPLFNAFFALTVFGLYPIHIIHHDVSWITPMFFNAYYATEGDGFAMMMQAVILLIDVMLYLPFVKRYAQTQSIERHHDVLLSHLDVAKTYHEKKDLQIHEAKHSIIEANIKMESIISLLQDNTMLLYLQPIVDIDNHSVSHYEALLRLQLKDGKVVGPYFLEDIENAGFATMIDLWVCQEVQKHLLVRESQYRKTQININMHPHTLSDTDSILQIIEMLKYENIAFEIIERELLDNQLAEKNLLLLQENGFKIYIDDVGDGYSSYMALCTLPLDCIKIDKALTDIMHTDKGFAVVEHLYDLSQSLGYECIIEGVETAEQIQIVREIGISYVQGFYYSKALDIQEAYAYTVQEDT